MLLAGINVLVSFSVFMGIVIDGPGPTCLPLLDLVKWMSLHFTWSVFSPLFLSHLWAVLKAVFMILVASSLVWGKRAEWFSKRLWLICLFPASLDLVVYRHTCSTTSWLIREPFLSFFP